MHNVCAPGSNGQLSHLRSTFALCPLHPRDSGDVPSIKENFKASACRDLFGAKAFNVSGFESFFASSFILYLEGALAYYTEIFALIFFNFSEIFLP